MNLDDYLERTRHEKTTAADLQTLRSIVFAHATLIPFESLDPLAGVTVSLDPNAIFDKLVRRRRGGYCFEQNALLAWALRKVGFDVAELSARVWYNTPAGITPPRTHIFLAVTIDDSFQRSCTK